MNYLRRAKNAVARVLPPNQHRGEQFEQLSAEFAKVLEDAEEQTRRSVICAVVDAQHDAVRRGIRCREAQMLDLRNRRN